MKLAIRKVIAAGVLLAVGLMGFSSPASAAKKAVSVNNTSMVVAEGVPPQTFDPIQSSQIATMYAWQNVYQGLVIAGLDGKIQPVLASKWTISKDGLTYDFTLRKGAQFSNGALLNADDVVYSFQRLKSKGLPYSQARFATVTSVTKIADDQVRFVLATPTAGFLLNLGSPYLIGSAIVNKKWTESNDPKLMMMGTGPFQMVSYSPNQQLVLKRNNFYWNKATVTTVANLTIRYMPDQSAQVAALQAGQIDLMFPNAESYLQIQKVPSIRTVAVNSASTIRLNLGTNNAPLDNVNVRRAISLALDRRGIVKGAFLGQAVPSAQIPPAYAWSIPVNQLQYQQVNIALAKKLLAKAGYPHGIKLTLNHLAGYATYLDRFAEIVKQQLGKAGIDVTIEANQNAVWLDKQNKANYQIMTNEYAFNGDPLFYLSPRPGRQGPNPPELDALIAAVSTGDPDNYTDGLRKIQIMEDNLVFPDITVAARKAWAAYGSKLTKVKLTPTLSRAFLADIKTKS